ncbi:Trypanosome variant surface glycoprotein C-terminal domain containing protein, putative [Trypanosoma equiperdum]|uniref:Trypanosome variant surface glycoprotein C-terminal domain containing protein, putative n=1 Tax=Trypanosoma equiperdum TaxID=5694 RepID=A0A1G4I769_TRYEQ|nr:Trypanosome variant surface glycoprotein C-terminal domain containing protein, putative [Trypanosoma equiperdum]
MRLQRDNKSDSGSTKSRSASHPRHNNYGQRRRLLRTNSYRKLYWLNGRWGPCKIRQHDNQPKIRLLQANICITGTREQQYQQKKAASDLVSQQVAKAYKLAEEAEALHKSLTSAAAAPKSNPESAAKAAKAAAECRSITKKATCQAKAEGAWESTDKTEGPHCKLNETYVAQKATQTGGSGTAATGCEKHGTDKEKCENDKTGDKQNCAFRKGKDGEDDKETEKCRNGSFLVNKQFALVVTAFVALLF